MSSTGTQEARTRSSGKASDSRLPVADAPLARYARLLSTLAHGEAESITTDVDRATVGEHLVRNLALRATFDDHAPQVSRSEPMRMASDSLTRI